MSRRNTHLQTAADSSPSRLPAASDEAAPPSRGSTSRAGNLHIPNSYGIVFGTPAQAGRFAILSRRGLVVTKYLDDELLRRLGLLDDVFGLLDVMGWRGVVTGNWAAYEDLTYEFFSTFKLRLVDDRVVGVEFRLGNQFFEWSLEELEEALGLPSDGMNDLPEDVDFGDAWEEITHEAGVYTPASSKASSICSPVLRYLHKLMACTLYGRETSQGVVEIEELGDIWCMLHNFRRRSGIRVAYHFDGVAKRRTGKIMVGGLVTAIAVSCGISLVNRNTFGEVKKLGYDILRKVPLLRLDGNVYRWIVREGVEIALPNPDFTAPRGETNLKMLHDALPQVPVMIEVHEQQPPQPAQAAAAEPSIRTRLRHLEQNQQLMMAQIEELQRQLRAQQPPPP